MSEGHAVSAPTGNTSVVKEAAEALTRGLQAIETIEQQADGAEEVPSGSEKDQGDEVGRSTKDDGETTSQTEKNQDNGIKSPIKWVKVLDLDYSISSENAPSEQTVCFKCGKPEELPDVKHSRCAKCQVGAYCSRQCQVADWKQSQPAGHKLSCAHYAKIGRQMILPSLQDKQAARDLIWSKTRFYSCPYAVHHRHILGVGPGCLFLQSSCTLAQLSLPAPVMSSGHHMSQTRSILLHYLTLGEYDREVCRDDFEMASVRTELKDAMEEYDSKKEVVYLMRFRCGHVAVGVAPLVPDFKLCKTLAKEYFANNGSEALQLNIDDA
jgi:hypothetical protein